MGSRFLFGVLFWFGLKVYMPGLVPGFAVAVVVQFVFADFAAEGVAMDS